MNKAGDVMFKQASDLLTQQELAAIRKAALALLLKRKTVKK